MLGAVVLLLTLFMIKFKLSDEAMRYLLSILGILLPGKHRCSTILYGLRKYLSVYTNLPQIRYYCSFCLTHVEKNEKVCPNSFCRKDLTVSGSVSYFVLHNLTKQLQILFKRKSFTESIRNHRFQRKVKKGVVSDFYDGILYQDLMKNGFLNDPNNLSFSINTDGVSIFKSSKVSMWPVYLIINELPIKERKLKENTLFYGVWISVKKPVMWSYLKPLYEEMKLLEQGVEFKDYEENQFFSKATILTCTCDLPAKCLVTNSKQFNGKFGCWYCLQEGETFRTEKGGSCHVFPPNVNDLYGPARTRESVMSSVKKVMT